MCLKVNLCYYMFMSLIEKMFKFPRSAKFVLNYLWPPWWFSGIKITIINNDFTNISIKMNLRFYNKNYVGTQFGGNLFAMTDPFYMLMLLKNLGNDYIVWDKSATIKFLKPGRTQVHVDFNLDAAKLALINAELAVKNPIIVSFPIEVLDKDKQLIATIDKNIYIRRKSPS